MRLREENNMIYEFFGVPASGKTVAAKILEANGGKTIRIKLSGIRFLFSKEFISFFHILHLLPKSRYKTFSGRIRSKTYLILSYTNMMNTRGENNKDYYLFSGIIEQIGGYYWYERIDNKVLNVLSKHILEYLSDVRFVFLSLPDETMAYQRMSCRYGKVKLCALSKEDAIKVISRLSYFFDEISRITRAKVFVTDEDLNSTRKSIEEYIKNDRNENER